MTHPGCDPAASGADNACVLLLTGIVLAVFVVPAPWAVPVVVVAALVEFTETAIGIWYSRRSPPKVGVETLIGSTGRVVTDCRPAGTVRVRGEVWQARCASGADTHDAVRVVGRDRLTLLVEPIE
jgi:membrane-bound ClpP family serine protease